MITEINCQVQVLTFSVAAGGLLFKDPSYVLDAFEAESSSV